MKWQSIIPLAYESLTQSQKKEICNGCGGKGGIVKPPHKVFFNASCNHHDYGYSCGGTEKDRKKADEKLYEMMVLDCSKLPWMEWVRYRPWCWAYYLGVRSVGWKFFYHGKKRWPYAGV